jgi:hypothetical protein
MRSLAPSCVGAVRSGAAIAVVGLVALVYSVIEAPDQGWLSIRTLGGMGAGLVVLAAFVGWELKQVHPMLKAGIAALAFLAVEVAERFRGGVCAAHAVHAGSGWRRR